jgi:hypothetical protein
MMDRERPEGGVLYDFCWVSSLPGGGERQLFAQAACIHPILLTKVRLFSLGPFCTDARRCHELPAASCHSSATCTQETKLNSH